MSYADLIDKLIRLGFKEKWHLKYGKYSRKGQQTLIAHALSTVSIALRLAEILEVDEKKKELIIYSAFMHDALKSDDGWQEAAIKFSRDPKDYWQRNPEKLEPLVNRIAQKLGLNEKTTKEILDVIYTVEGVESIQALDKILSARPDPLIANIVRLADIIASFKRPEEIRKLNRSSLKGFLSSANLNFAYHKVNVVRGILTQILHTAVEQAYANYGYAPLAYFADGTIYVTTKNKNIDWDQLRVSIIQEIKRSFREFFNRYAKDMGRKAFGKITQTVVVAPEFLFYSDTTIESFWRQHKDISGDNFEAKYAMIFNGILKTIRDNIGSDAEDHAKEIAKQILKNKLGRKEEDIELIFNVQHTSKKEIKNKVAELFRVEQLMKGGIEKFRERLIEIFIEITKEIRKHLLENRDRYDISKILIDTHIESIANALLEDLAHPTAIDIVNKTEKITEEYLKGKKTPPLCVICGREAKTEALAALVGDGAERFINALPAGGPLGGKYKAWICDLCLYERKLRSIFYHGKILKDYVYIVPQISMGFLEVQILKRHLLRAFNGWQTGGGLLGSYSNWAETIVSNPKTWAEKIIDDFPDSLIPQKDKSTNKAIKIIKQLIEENEEFLDIVKMYYPDCKTPESIYSQFRIDKLEKIREDPIGELLADELETRFRDEGLLTREVIIDYAPNYLIIAIPSLALRDDPETAATLRKIFIGTFIALAFQVAVIFADHTDVLREYQLECRGFCSYKPKLLVRKLFAKYDIGYSMASGQKVFGWIGIDNAERTLTVLASALMIEDYLKRYRVDYGSNTLIEIMKRPTGMLLQRFISTKQKKENLLSFLSFLDLLDLYRISIL